MAEKNYIGSIKDLLEDLRQITIEAMASTGIKKTSDLAKSVKFMNTRDGIAMEVNFYYPFVSEGHMIVRPPRIKKVPLDALIQWIKANNILPRSKKSGRFVTVNQMAWAVQMSIWKRGIKSKMPTMGRGFAQVVADDVADEAALRLADELANEVLSDLSQTLEI